ncbi:hypothetical protein [Nannocystis punicea]|uniref:Uncharacterized protein n=1 Tax=Nannocystis punicea TaxID=2995304 RepID=A0ABY7GVP0_9BACT|nr:hypothetical protein [Nannocystis poenicansa]WAS90879.1 hypothetical protein O0S08_32220 [Nannocystis poenicansa]
MKGARNEDSVLFSLASLGSLDVARVAESPAPVAVAKRPVSQPEPTDGSGLIDVRAMGAVIQAERPQARAPRFSELTAPPPVIPPTPVRGRATAAPPPMPLYLLLGVVALGMMGLAGFLATQGPMPAPVIIERHISQAPMVVASAAEPEEEPEPEAEPEAVAVAAEIPAETPEAAPSKRPRKPVVKPATPSADKPPPVKVVTPAAPSGPANDSVECLLSPDKCKAKPAAPAKVEPAPSVSTDSLPEKLEPADIADGTRAAKAAALERCRVHARGGEKVTIKLSIAGPDGKVLSSAPQEDAGNPALANCAAGELMRASFKKVSKAQIGAVATLKF